MIKYIDESRERAISRGHNKVKKYNIIHVHMTHGPGKHQIKWKKKIFKEVVIGTDKLKIGFWLILAGEVRKSHVTCNIVCA